MDPLRIDVRAASRTYPVLVGEALIEHLAALLDAAGVGPRRFVVSSPLVWKLHGSAVSAALPGAKAILMPDGERFKHLRTVDRIYEALIRGRVDRASAVIAVGGGVVGDVTGFAAATLLRGVALAHVPTTLLAQVDSAIGGKVGVNHALGKNLIGAFHPPTAVVADAQVLGTLPRREFRAGLYEVVKYGVIASRELFERVAREMNAIFARRSSVLVPIIAECCRIKAGVVEADERERGPRRVLNLGHTVGHALEAVTRYRRFRHGEAIAYGMLAAAEIAVARHVLDDEERQAIARVIVQMGPLPPIGDLTVADTLAAVGRDKKMVDGALHFVLPTAIGSTVVLPDVTEHEITRSLTALGMRR